MKVLLLNGSPHAAGCTCLALREAEKELQAAGLETELFQVGSKPIAGCTACGWCGKNGGGKCVREDDPVNAFLEKARGADAFVFGSPVHYAAASGAVTSLLDRAFYAGKGIFRHKPGACVVSCRRGGATAAFEQLSKYLTISEMPVVSSQYWNMLHGNTPEEAAQDFEGLQIMRTLGRNMAWLLKCIEAGAQNGIAPPKSEPRVNTNFIR